MQASGNMSGQFDSDPRHRSNFDPRKVDWRHADLFLRRGVLFRIVGPLHRGDLRSAPAEFFVGHNLRESQVGKG